jgi:N-sulfoglucosamine sulfohydrolase
MRQLILLLTFLTSAFARDSRPNILWITSEDNAAHWLGCYGNAQASTPRLDRLASEGNRFSNAFSNAAVCAVARSTIFTGVHAPGQGTHHMRSRHPIPAEILPYVTYFRKAGYHTTNQSKTDYNFKGNDNAWWDDSSNRAHYRNRSAGQPFFAVINEHVTHESSLFSEKRGEGRTRIAPEDVMVPPHLPDLPEVRADIAVYHDKISQLDQRVGQILDQLEADGLADDTIVFYYADHGGPMPRGKRYLEDTGVHVPLIVRVPEKWRHLSPFAPGDVVDELVSFVDFAPTVLSLIGIPTPDYMQGRSFLGEHRAAPGDGVFLYADRFDEIYGMRRGWTDGRWKYMRRFSPHLPAAPYSTYQFSMPSWVAIRQAWLDGKLEKSHARMWEAPQEIEVLYDTESDPWEVRNLADDPQHAGRLAAMRGRLKREMAAMKDAGVIPEPMFADLAKNSTIAEFVRSADFDHAAALDLAFAATSGDPADARTLKQAASSTCPVQRHWALLGMLLRGGGDPDDLRLEDDHPINRILSAELLIANGDAEVGKNALVAELNRTTGESALAAINAIHHHRITGEAVDAWANAILKDRKSNEYLKRWAQKILGGR